MHRFNLNVNACDSVVGSPLYTVVSQKWLEGARILLNAGADPLNLSGLNQKQ